MCAMLRDSYHYCITKISLSFFFVNPNCGKIFMEIFAPGVNNMSFSENMRKIRIKKKLSQTDLEKRCGVSQSAISAIERGERSPTEETMRMIAKGLRVPLSALLDDAEKPATDAGSGLKDEIIDLLDDLREDEALRMRDYAEWLLSRRGKE